MRRAILVLEDGAVFEGLAFGALGQATGEVVFNTGMTGYQEVLTDPSYRGQIVTMTAPQVGNTGINPEDSESSRPWLAGFIVRQASPTASNWRSTLSLEAYLREHGIVGMTGAPTRALVRRIRSRGVMRAVLSSTELNADYANGSFAPVWVSLQLQPDGTQTLTLYRKPDDSQNIVLARLTDLDSGFVDVRLLIDPAADTVNLRVNGADFGTYPYSTYSPGVTQLSRKFVSIGPSGSSAEFDAIAIRVGGNWP